MYINSTGYYIPEKRVPNSYFADLSGKDEEWFYQRTGMISRARATERETLDYMGIEAVKRALGRLSYDIKEVDLVIFASYTPADTVATTAHVIQREFQIDGAKVFSLSAACSSAVNAMEIIRAFFETGNSRKALLVCGDRNTFYSDDQDGQAGHLWGDAATALFFSREPQAEGEIKVLDITSAGLGNIGLGPKAVGLQPRTQGLQMPYGKDIFMQACTYMARYSDEILKKNGYVISDLSYFISHQANMRIISHVCKELGVPEEKSLNNLEELGNTGCCSSLLVLAQNEEKFRKNDLICLSAFGGGYSVGTCLFTVS